MPLDFIRLGTPVENAFIESCNGRLRDECLNVHQFVTFAEAQHILETWRLDYNQCRPLSSLGHLTPKEFLGPRQAEQIDEEFVSSSEELSRYGANVICQNVLLMDRLRLEGACGPSLSARRQA